MREMMLKGRVCGAKGGEALGGAHTQWVRTKSCGWREMLPGRFPTMRGS